MAKKNNTSSKKSFLGTWMTRIWKGASTQLADEMDEKAKNMAVEEIVSPLQQVIRNFLDRKLAVAALIVLKLNCKDSILLISSPSIKLLVIKFQCSFLFPSQQTQL